MSFDPGPLGSVDVRWVILAVVLLGVAAVCHRYPRWTGPLTVAIAAGGLVVVVLF